MSFVDELLDARSSSGEFDVVDLTVELAHWVRLRVLLGDRGDEFAAELVDAITARQRYIGQVFVSALPLSDRQQANDARGRTNVSCSDAG